MMKYTKQLKENVQVMYLMYDLHILQRHCEIL